MFGKNDKTKESGAPAVSHSQPSKLAAAKEIRTLIGEGCKVEGNFFIPNATRIDGIIKGDLTGDSGVVIGTKGRIEGSIAASEAIIYGTVIGNVDVYRLELKKGSSMNGDITVVNLITEQGCIFNGKCIMKPMEENHIPEPKTEEGEQ